MDLPSAITEVLIRKFCKHLPDCGNHGEENGRLNVEVGNEILRANPYRFGNRQYVADHEAISCKNNKLFNDDLNNPL